MGIYRHCSKNGRTISDVIGFCADCIRKDFEQVWPAIKGVHGRSRRAYGMPENPPRSKNGIPCSHCLHQYRIPEGGVGFCSLRRLKVLDLYSKH